MKRIINYDKLMEGNISAMVWIVRTAKGAVIFVVITFGNMQGRMGGEHSGVGREGLPEGIIARRVEIEEGLVCDELKGGGREIIPTVQASVMAYMAEKPLSGPTVCDD